MATPQAVGMIEMTSIGIGHLVEDVEHGDLRPASRGGDLRRHRLERRPGPPGQEDVRALAGEGPGDTCAEPPGAVDDRGLVGEEHAGKTPAERSTHRITTRSSARSRPA